MTLCLSTTETDTVREWLTSAPVRDGGRGLQPWTVLPSLGEGLAARETTEAVVGTAVPWALLPGRYDDEGRRQYVGRTTALAKAAGTAVARMLRQGRRGHPWTGWSCSAGWGSRETLDVTAGGAQAGGGSEARYQAGSSVPA